MIKKNLTGNVKGSTIFGKIILAWLMIIIIYAIGAYVMVEFSGWALAIVPLILAFCSIYLAVYIIYVFIKYTIHGIAYDKPINFNLSTGKFLGQMVLGSILTVITFGIYMPWFYKRIAKVAIENSDYEGNDFKFNGSGTKLFIYMIIAVVLVSASSWILSMLLGEWIAVGASFAMYSFMYTLGVKWLLNVTYKGVDIKYEGSTGSLILFAIGQTLLTLVTFGIYLPASFIMSFKHVIKNIKGADKYSYDFDGSLGGGFFMILLNVILTIITIGIYGPWAYARITNWFADHTVVIINEPAYAGDTPTKVDSGFNETESQYNTSTQEEPKKENKETNDMENEAKDNKQEEMKEESKEEMK